MASPLPIKTTARKLPIKRKPQTPEPSTNPIEPSTTSSFKPQTLSDEGDDDDDPRSPPFKFHRIWSESDETRFLRGLLSASAEGLSIPRDLNLFYDRFLSTMSSPYSKSQLSEKLRRLRKKFRIVSSRLSRGLDFSLLSSHDRDLFELSKQLWDIKNPNNNKPRRPQPRLYDKEVVVKAEGIDRCTVRAILNVFDRSLEEVRMTLVKHRLIDPDRKEFIEKRGDLERRWREQRIEELSLLSRRLRLVLENVA
ncbi:hypothetical protein QJS04_geneDACA021226 [Acorus gramineus]|uniref:Glabrous enhancer-binding protein-like DBD domain-containing protein n=1 Tax=Acorus gramineus TaxID=55184 RepID=A0AAV9AIY6_ACOGR|nr:hypothetical protein QJS04_geneDACA021226 [Acorus gramineus]